MMVHIADAVQDGHQSVMIRSTDPDLVALVVATLDLKELWVSYGTRKKLQNPTGTSLCKGSWSI